jgi:eukaryotic-like serine/threonine-protein kinase
MGVIVRSGLSIAPAVPAREHSGVVELAPGTREPSFLLVAQGQVQQGPTARVKPLALLQLQARAGNAARRHQRSPFLEKDGGQCLVVGRRLGLGATDREAEDGGKNTSDRGSPSHPRQPKHPLKEPRHAGIFAIARSRVNDGPGRRQGEPPRISPLQAMLGCRGLSQQLVAPKLPAVIASRYIPIRLIGRGGMGVVYEVEHTRTGEHLALKVLLSTVEASPDALERFKREARASARIKSENVVRVTDADVAPELDGAPFLVMELLEGMDIEKAASASRPMPATVVGWLRQVAVAIDKAHRLGIVHRDLKPENLFLANLDDRAPVVKILDFGIAKMAQEGTGATGSGQVLGTPKYMAPEQAAGNARVTPATDLYALGLVAYRLLMGESYYKDDNVMSILGLLLHGQLELPSARDPKFGAALDDWFKKACSRAPEGRFASAAVQVEALAEALGLPTTAFEPPPERSSLGSSSSVEASSKLRGSVPALTAAAVVAIALAAFFIYRASVATSSSPMAIPTAAPPPAAAPTAAPVLPKGGANELPAPAPGNLATQPSAIAAGGAHGTAKKSRAAVHVPATGPGAAAPTPPADDPFRDQK